MSCVELAFVLSKFVVVIIGGDGVDETVTLEVGCGNVSIVEYSFSSDIDGRRDGEYELVIIDEFIFVVGNERKQ